MASPRGLARQPRLPSGDPPSAARFGATPPQTPPGFEVCSADRHKQKAAACGSGFLKWRPHGDWLPAAGAAHSRCARPFSASLRQTRVLIPVPTSFQNKSPPSSCDQWLLKWRPHGDSNPGSHRERVVSWTRLDDGDKKERRADPRFRIGTRKGFFCVRRRVRAEQSLGAVDVVYPAGGGGRMTVSGRGRRTSVEVPAAA